jgi:RecB family endonuclease NucS
VRLVIARCSVDYAGRLGAHLDSAVRLLMVKADGSVLVHAEGGAYKPLNWMNPPNTLVEEEGRWVVRSPKGETLTITIEEVVADYRHDLGVDPGLQKDGVEAHLQQLLAADPSCVEVGLRLVRREYPTDIGPVDLLCHDPSGEAVSITLTTGDATVGAPAISATDVSPAEDVGGLAGGRFVAIEVKRRAGIDAVEQLTRYLERLDLDPRLRPVRGIVVAQSIAPQARVLAEARGIRCVAVDYDVLRGAQPSELRLF